MYVLVQIALLKFEYFFRVVNPFSKMKSAMAFKAAETERLREAYGRPITPIPHAVPDPAVIKNSSRGGLWGKFETFIDTKDRFQNGNKT